MQLNISPWNYVSCGLHDFFGPGRNRDDAMEWQSWEWPLLPRGHRWVIHRVINSSHLRHLVRESVCMCVRALFAGLNWIIGLLMKHSGGGFRVSRSIRKSSFLEVYSLVDNLKCVYPWEREMMDALLKFGERILEQIAVSCCVWSEEEKRILISSFASPFL